MVFGENLIIIVSSNSTLKRNSPLLDFRVDGVDNVSSKILSSQGAAAGNPRDTRAGAGIVNMMGKMEAFGSVGFFVVRYDCWCWVGEEPQTPGGDPPVILWYMQ